jgi:hypothetical protein
LLFEHGATTLRNHLSSGVGGTIFRRSIQTVPSEYIDSGHTQIHCLQRKNSFDKSDGFFKKLKSRESLNAWEDGVEKFQEVALKNLLCLSQFQRLGPDYFVGKGVKIGVVLRGLDEVGKMLRRPKYTEI